MTPVWLRVESEIEREGLPPGIEAWSGPTIGAFQQIRDHLGLVADEASA